MLTNERGLTLVELLAAITISGIVLTTILFFSQYSSHTVANISTREDVMKQSRSIINHIIHAVRDNLVEASADASHELMLNEIIHVLDGSERKKEYTNNHIYYIFDEATSSVTFEKHWDGRDFQQTLSSNVVDLNITLSEMNPKTNSNEKIDIELIMQLPNNQTYTAATTIFIPKL
jgi:prepilin-type N-terminal cleavage/methylation domain-containing protein